MKTEIIKDVVKNMVKNAANGAAMTFGAHISNAAINWVISDGPGKLISKIKNLPDKKQTAKKVEYRIVGENRNK